MSKKILASLDFGLTPEQRAELGAAFALVGARYERGASRVDATSSLYAAGVADGLNHAWKIVMGVDDDYYRSGEE